MKIIRDNTKNYKGNGAQVTKKKNVTHMPVIILHDTIVDLQFVGFVAFIK